MKPLSLIGRISHSARNRGIAAWLIAIGLLLFYVTIYFAPYGDGPEGRPGLDRIVGERLLAWLPDELAPNRWTLYGMLYSLAVVGGGVVVLRKWRHDRYQVVRTSVVMVVQVTLAFSIPLLLKFLGRPEYYFSYMWPLKLDALDPRNFGYYGPALAAWGFLASLVLAPALTLLFGKRWYCSWVCGCGGLANTFGDPWRHLSSKSRLAWQAEKVSIHAVLILALATTASWYLAALLPDSDGAVAAESGLRRFYSLVVTASLSGVAGVALYPIGGTRVWCRFFCPMAAALGLLQKLGRFRIRVKRDMCISCGRCSHFCEMGIDVRSYAQGNRSFTRASCVGCGMCAHVCPRGVLRLENRRPRDPQELSMEALVSRSYVD